MAAVTSNYSAIDTSGFAPAYNHTPTRRTARMSGRSGHELTSFVVVMDGRERPCVQNTPRSLQHPNLHKLGHWYILLYDQEGSRATPVLFPHSESTEHQYSPHRACAPAHP
jgi:hypothetical protein